MDAIQVVAAATQIVSSMVGAVSALEHAYRNLDEAPKRIRILEEFVSDLDNLTRRLKQRHAIKLQNTHLHQQIHSLNALIERLHPSIRKARAIVSRSKVKNLAKIVWGSMAGDPFGKIVQSIRYDLNLWLESQKMILDVENMIESTAQDIPLQFKVTTEQGYPVSSKCKLIRHLLEHEGTHQVILLVGLSGIGKSCLARQVASYPPIRFFNGAVEIGFGQWCSRAACNGDKVEYQKRLARKICRFLVQIGFWKKIKDEDSKDLEYVCCLLQDALYGKNLLILLDDVWEQDIIQRFVKLYDNGCKFLVTTRNEAVYEIMEADKVELSKDDSREISKSILIYHSLLSEAELPSIADSLLERCGYHPLTVAVMGKALRKETRTEKWEKAITDLSTFATCAPGPVSYVNEKEAENTLTIFGSLEFSLEQLPKDSKNLFITFSALSWVEPVPEACIEAMWSVLGAESMFPLIVCKLVEGSLLMKTDPDPFYHIHDMVSLYLDGKTDNSIKLLLNEPVSEKIAFICPWVVIFGKEDVKMVAKRKMEFFLDSLEEPRVVITLEAIIQALMVSKSISELEASRARFSDIVGPRIADLFSTDLQSVIAVSSEAITNLFSIIDYSTYFPSLESTDIVEKLGGILDNSEDHVIQINILTVLAKLAEFGKKDTVTKVLQIIPFDRLAHLLCVNTEEWHEDIFTILISLIKAGKSKSVEIMLAFEIDKVLVKLLENGSEVVQHHAIITLKMFYELAGKSASSSLQPANLKLLPWRMRLRLENFVLSDQNATVSPKLQSFEDLMHKLLSHDNKRVLEAMQDLIPVVEKAGDSIIREMITHSLLIERLSELLEYKNSKSLNSIRSRSAFLITTLACTGGESCIRKFLEYNTIPELVKMMQCPIPELQDAAYSALHQMLFNKGGAHVLNELFQMGLLEKITSSLDSRVLKTREVNLLCVLDIVELANKACIERMLSSQVVEKLVKLEKVDGDNSGESLVGFLKGMDKCKHLSVVERRVMKQQVVRKARAGLRGHKSEAQILAAMDACLADGSRGSGSSGGSGKYRK
ncbi:hypothetical protein ACFE04_031943 [Oxalis oulophora]